MKIRYAKVKIATRNISLKIRLFFAAFFFPNILALFKLPHARTSLQPVPTAAAPGREWDVLVVTSCRDKAHARGQQLKAVSSSLARVTSCNQQLRSFFSHTGGKVLLLANAVSSPWSPAGCVSRSLWVVKTHRLAKTALDCTLQPILAWEVSKFTFTEQVPWRDWPAANSRYGKPSRGSFSKPKSQEHGLSNAH